MIRNYVDETYIKGFFPELTKYLWSGETDFSKQKEKAEQIVINDLIARGYTSYLLRTPLALRTAGTSVTVAGETGTKSAEDVATRLRLTYDIDTLTTPVTLTLQGTNDSSSETWYTITTVTPTAIGESSQVVSQCYKYFRINTSATGSGYVDYSANMIDITMDMFFAYKWAELICLNAVVEEGDQFDIKRKYFADEYAKLWNTSRIFEDLNESEDLDESEGQSSNEVTFTT